MISTALVQGDIAALRAEAEHDHVAPRDAWDLECVQLDPTTPVPCSLADRKKYAPGNINLVPIPSGAGSAEIDGGAPGEADDFAAWEAQQAAEQAAGGEGGARDGGAE